jgi:lactoylglutathione lyase
MGTWIGPYGINVTDLEASVAFYEALGLTCTRRIEADGARQAVIGHPDKGGQAQLAQRDEGGPVEMGGAFWKLYVATNDLEGVHADALAAGVDEVMAPMRMEQWPMSVSFVEDRDGYLVELIQRHPWRDGDDTTRAWLGQVCLNVTDLDRAVAFYETLGLTCTSRTSIPDAEEAIVEHEEEKGGKLQLAQQHAQDGPIEPGSAFRKLCLFTDDIEAVHAAAVAAGHISVRAPTRLDQWPVTVGLVDDPDGYRIELLQPHTP